MPRQTHKQQYDQGRTDFFAGRPRGEGSFDFYHQGYNSAKELASLGVYFRYCMLPGGNRDQFAGIDEELKRRGIVFEYAEQMDNPDRNRGRMYRISCVEGHKLPQDNYKGVRGVPYLPTSEKEEGHSLYEMYYDFAEEQRREFGYWDWKKVTPFDKPLGDYLSI